MATGLLNSNHENLTNQSSTQYKSGLSPSSSSSDLASSLSPTQLQTKKNDSNLICEKNIEETKNATNTVNTGNIVSNNPSSKNGSSSRSSKSFKIEIPRISSSREIHPQRAHSPCNELEQRSFLFSGPGSKRDVNKQILKMKTVELEEAVKKAKKYAMEQSVRFALVKQQQQQQKQQLDLIKKQQALLLMCRIYVGSIFYEVKEEAVKIAFGAFGPIRSITMSWDAATNKHKGFAFIEFETPEAAQLAYEQMNGVLLGGRNIKVGRPSNMPQAQPIIDQMNEEARARHRIYVASIHSELTEQDVQSVFEAFGSIRSCVLVRDIQTGKHKGYGFIEFETAQSSQDAIASMNLFDLGGQFLRVGRAVTPPDVLPGQATNSLTGLSPAQTTGSGSSVTAGLAAQLQDIGVFNPINSSTSILTTSSLSSNLIANSTSKQSSTNLNSGSVAVSATATSTTSNITQPSVTSLVATNQSSQTKTAAQPSPTLSISSSSTTLTTQTQNLHLTTQTTSTAVQQIHSNESLSKIELTENQKKLLGMSSIDDAAATLEQQSELTVKGKEQRLLLMQKLMRRQPESKVIILRNMVGPEDVDEELEIEITEECEKFGEVERVVIYQERQSEEEDAEIIVKIFVEFSEANSVELAINSLNGRYFAGRVVKAEIYDQSAYDSKDYSG